MIKIRVTTNNNVFKYVSESYPFHQQAIVLVDTYSEGLLYENTLEFKVTWRLLRIQPPYIYDSLKKGKYDLIKKEEIIKFESIDDSSLEIKTFNINDEEIELSREIFFKKEDFNLLKKCFIECSHWLYDAKNN